MRWMCPKILGRGVIRLFFKTAREQGLDQIDALPGELFVSFL